MVLPRGGAEPGAARPLLDAALLEHFGSREAVKAGTARLLAPVHGLVRTAGAMRSLAARYPDGEEARPLVIELEQAAVGDLDQLRALWSQVPALRMAVPAEGRPSNCGDWRRRATLFARPCLGASTHQ